MIPPTLQALAGLALLFAGGEALVRGAVTLATRLGVSRLAIGLTVVAIGTSAPELFVSLDAALEGADGISLGNIVGSNIANIALILGIAALVRPAEIHTKLVRIDIPLVIAVSLGLVAVLYSGEIDRLEGGALLIGGILYTAFTVWETRRIPDPTQGELASAAPAAPDRRWPAVALALAGLALLPLGGRLLVEAAVDLATDLGVSQATIGLTIVAVGTSLPEFAASVVATRRGQGDIAVGNVVGSNLFNILAILGLTAVVSPLASDGVRAVDLWMMVGMAVLLAVFVSTGRRLGRIEGAVLLSTYIAYTTWLIA